ncbi:Fcf1-domain-containing protein [Protomyces lactucae-debilis]|uniref:U three protein 23 n=1 Tax=Protomyces lactucae-debilis TaxID=2754530 RepID=A0A1Y2FDK6_PROLT|nr:Fcf1-domain-containing protein [Protomyces lactucae-debilis]ORY82010.1 Fcf1-domain-containing protein [Protomyces lactucae-debilis]
MRQKRAKAYKKLMATYERTFAFRQPYQVLYTADFIEACQQLHLEAQAGVARILQADKHAQGGIKTMISQCCIKELYDKKANDSIGVAKEMERRRCGHVEKPELPADCVCECVGANNKHRYIVCTQDATLRQKLRLVPGVPLVYINRSVLILEPPSPATLTRKAEKETGRLGLSVEEAQILGKRKRVANPTAVGSSVTAPAAAEDTPDDKEESTGAEQQEVQAQQPKKRARGPKGPNPLSVKKPKSILKTRKQ